MKKPKRCKGCVFFHDAGHPKTAGIGLLKYNMYCTAYSKPAPKALGQCKNEGKKRLKTDDL